MSKENSPAQWTPKSIFKPAESNQFQTGTRTAALSVDIDGENSAITAIRNTMQCALVNEDDGAAVNVSLWCPPHKLVDDITVIFL